MLDRTEIILCGCPGERLHAEFRVTADADTANLEVSWDSPCLDIYAIKAWWQHGRSIGAYGKYLNEELLLRDASLIDTNETESFVRDNGGTYHCITGEGTTLPENIRIYDAAVLQSVALKAGASQKYWVTITIPQDATGWIKTVIEVSTNGRRQYLPVVVEILPFRLLPPKQLIGCYYLGCLSDEPDPPLSHRYFLSEQRMLAELRLMREIGIDYPSWYAEGTKWIDAAMSLRTKAGFPTDKIFWTTIRTDTGTEAELRQRCQNMRKMFPDSDVYLYGKEEVVDQISQIPRWDITREEGCKVWNAMYAAQVGAVVGHIDLVNIAGTSGGHTSPSEHIESIKAGGGHVACYACPHLGQDVSQWAIRRNYGWLAWSLGYNAIFPYALRDHGNSQHPWLDWSGDIPYRPIIAAYPTSGGCIRTIQLEALGDAITDLRYLATLEAAIKNAPPSKHVQRQAAEDWIAEQKKTASAINGTAAMDQCRLKCIHHLMELS